MFDMPILKAIQDVAALRVADRQPRMVEVFGRVPDHAEPLHDSP